MDTEPVTQAVQIHSVSRDDLEIIVIDTPGLENELSFPKIEHEIDVMLHQFQPTNIIYLITIKIGRYTQKEREILDHIFKNQGAKMKNAMIIFTNRNELTRERDPENRSMKKWIQKNPTLLKLITDNELKYRAFENIRLNEDENELQVRDLLSVVLENKIYVDKEIIQERFGGYGLKFFQEQTLKQKK